jgi:Ca2+-binding RTX toxin-like protein
MATGFAKVSGIQDVTGGIGNNLLVGDANANILMGGTGRNILIGGAGADTLDAHPSTGENLLIGGRTDYDSNLAALDAIFAEWTRTDLPLNNSFVIRYNDLLSGTGSANPLNRVNGQLILLTPATNKTSSNGTVHADSSPDTLIGSNGTDPTTGQRVHNWLFYDLDDTIVNFMNPYDRKNKVT